MSLSMSSLDISEDKVTGFGRRGKHLKKQTFIAQVVPSEKSGDEGCFDKKVTSVNIA